MSELPLNTGPKRDHNLAEIKTTEVSIFKKAKAEEYVEHSHILRNIPSISDEYYECMECNARFDLASQLIQHLETHKFLDQSKPQFECKLCPFHIKDTSNRSSDECEDILKKHIIVDHFKAPASVMKFNLLSKDVSYIKESTQANPEGVNERAGVFKCGVCPRSFNQVNHRRIHERYMHQNSITRDTAQLKKFVKCATCKSLCKDGYQYRLHKELYCDVTFDCQKCSEKFQRISHLATHMKLKHGARSEAKTRDIFIPISASRNWYALKQKSGPPPLKALSPEAPALHACIVCDDVKERDGDVLISHVIGQHTFDISEDRPAQCSRCTLQLTDVKDFADHYSSVHLNE